ncbi:hypothetical protein DICSQDRAFT_174892 [Dichomitus squalens LYAD-421 SS1]|uniref:Uncharacterized protein n=2 Tax=Dichomitus squalens TaxID=114155 RepID=A0A4Q9M6X9_9APHY|nr:uncharacterized protein DICSQDRAFT_174892 [Dichomitus squalens LYAD-421 SS1]EJF56441.1 hypothetical protein DICSQDRAFT_174892 [Dichomitus squalens LYAD-421 SS1]TBU21376.1 hypothetical protein BD311DRAFT_782953 [Dichomitus squalens]TBU53051.1 hypothetical protein BD310DRAFT_981416 [Dichomitus squalens]
MDRASSSTLFLLPPPLFEDGDLPVLLDKAKAGRFSIPHDVDARAHQFTWRRLEDVNRRIIIPEILRYPFHKIQRLKPMFFGASKLDEIASSDQ